MTTLPGDSEGKMCGSYKRVWAAGSHAGRSQMPEPIKMLMMASMLLAGLHQAESAEPKGI